MTSISITGSKEFFTNDCVDPKIASYVYYNCEYCNNRFQLAEPDNNFQAGCAIRFKRYRNPHTDEIKASENRAEGVCLACAKEIMRKQQQEK